MRLSEKMMCILLVAALAVCSAFLVITQAEGEDPGIGADSEVFGSFEPVSSSASSSKPPVSSSSSGVSKPDSEPSSSKPQSDSKPESKVSSQNSSKTSSVSSSKPESSSKPSASSSSSKTSSKSSLLLLSRRVIQAFGDSYDALQKQSHSYNEWD